MALAVFMGIVTFGVLPAILAATAASRRKTLQRYFKLGTPTVAEITSIEGEKDELGGRHGRVRFQYEADGQLHRSSDKVAQTLADKWRPGDEIEILYLPEDNYDGIIISTR
jgi:hypothetical protein